MKVGKKAFGLLNYKASSIPLMRNASSQDMDSWIDDYQLMVNGEGIEQE